MALLQRCSLHQRSSAVVLASNISVKGVTTRVLCSSSQCRPSMVCRAAASSSGSVGASRDGEGAAQSSEVFKDEFNGIVCQTDEGGEVICEGWDEGPHFQPEPEKGFTMRKRVSPRRTGKARGEVEPAVGFQSSGVKMQESIRESTAETSFNSSEL